jgi:hypothetical protein
MSRLFHWVILKQLADQFALRTLINEPHQNGIASPLVVGRVIVKSDMVPQLRIVVEGTGMGVILRAETELGPYQTTQEIDEGSGSIQIEKARGFSITV